MKLVWHCERISPHRFATTNELAGKTFGRGFMILKRDAVDGVYEQFRLRWSFEPGTDLFGAMVRHSSSIP
jgi:hypothetical protein